MASIEKTLVQEEIQEKGPEDESTTLLPAPRWVPGALRQFPFLGFIGFVVVFVGLGFAIAILIHSNGKRVKEWPSKSFTITPNVLVNLSNQLSSLGLITAITCGLSVVCWRRALHGSTLKKLHMDYNYAGNVVSTIFSTRRLNTIALAALMIKFGIVDSTLYQKSTNTLLSFQTNYATANILAWVEQQWPQGQGGVPGADGDVETVTKKYADIIAAFNSKVGNGKVHDTQLQFLGCPPAQTCSHELDAIGFSYECSTSTENVDYGSFLGENGTEAADIVLPLWSVAFESNWANDTKPYASINLNMLYVSSEQGPGRSCPGLLTRRTCQIRPALVRYPLIIQEADPFQSINVTHLGYTIPPAIDYPYNAEINTSQIDGIQVLKNIDLVEKFGEESTIGALAFTLNNLFRANATIDLHEDSNWDLTVSGSRVQSHFFANSTAQISQSCAYMVDHTMMGEPDPFVGLLRDVNSFAFVTALYLTGAPMVKPALRASQGFHSFNFTADVSGYTQQYHTNYRFLAAAVVATLFSVMCVVPTYWGYWELGRRVSLDPFEIAQALQAPLLSEVQTRKGYLSEVLKQVGDQKVRYGRLIGSKRGQLAIAEENKVVAMARSE